MRLRRFLAVAVEASGLVVDRQTTQHSSSKEGGTPYTVYRPVVRFLARDGRTMEFVASDFPKPPPRREDPLHGPEGGWRRSSVPLNQPVPVRYDPTTGRAFIADFRTLRGTLTMVSVGAVMFFVGGVVLVVLAERGILPVPRMPF